MTGNDTLTRRGIAAAVLLVAAIAAIVSYIHIQNLAVTHGQTSLAAALLPFSIDGTVVASSLVLLRAAWLDVRPPWLAQVMLLSSVLATLAANVAYGAAAGVTGALLSGWPAYAFIGCTEMAILMARRTRKPGATEAVQVSVLDKVPSDVLGAARASMSATYRAGNPLSANQLQRQFSLTRTQATTIHDEVLSLNGSGPHD